LVLQGSGLKSKRFTLFGQMYDRYALEPPPAELTLPPEVSTQLQGVIDLADLYPLERLVATSDLTAAAGTFVAALTVPTDQRWHLKVIDTETVDANTRIAMRDPAGDLVTLTVGAVVFSLLQEISHLRLDADWTLGWFTTGQAGDGDREFRLAIARERLN